MFNITFSMVASIHWHVIADAAKARRRRRCCSSFFFEGLVPRLGTRLGRTSLQWRFSVLGAVYTETRKTPRHVVQL